MNDDEFTIIIAAPPDEYLWENGGKSKLANALIDWLRLQLGTFGGIIEAPTILTKVEGEVPDASGLSVFTRQPRVGLLSRKWW